MDRADSAVSGALQRLTSPPVLLAVLALIVAGVIALLVARALRTRAARAAGSPPPPAHWLDRSLRGAVILAPFRSEERRVGKECRSRWSPYNQKKKIQLGFAQRQSRRGGE